MCEVSQKSPMVYYMPHFGDILLDLLCAVFCPATKLIMSLGKKEETLEVFSLLSFKITKIVIFHTDIQKTFMFFHVLVVITRMSKEMPD